MGSSNKDLYGLLGLPRTASQDEVRKAHRRLVREFHPDANPADPAAERFKEVQQAYEVLSDPSKRREYDERLRRAASSSSSAATPGDGAGSRTSGGVRSGGHAGRRASTSSAGRGRSTSGVDLSDLLGRLKEAFSGARTRESPAGEQHVPGGRSPVTGSEPREKKVKGPSARRKEKKVKGPRAKRKGD